MEYKRGLKDKLQNTSLPTEKFIRYQPDAIIIHKTAHDVKFIEPKNSITIEKDAYLTYIGIHKFFKCNILMCIKNNNIYHIPIEKLKLDWKSRPITHHGFKIPIDEEGWISPRLMDYNLYKKWQTKTGGSGTPFNFIMFQDMTKYIISYKNTRQKIEEPKYKYSCEFCGTGNSFILLNQCPNCGEKNGDGFFTCITK